MCLLTHAHMYAFICLYKEHHNSYSITHAHKGSIMPMMNALQCYHLNI